MKESKFSIDQRCIRRETFNSLDDISRAGGTPTAVTLANGVASFNGSTSKIAYPLTDTFTSQYSGSIEAKFFVSALPGAIQYIMGSADTAGTTNAFGIGPYTDNTFRILIQKSGNKWVTSTNTIRVGWNHIVATSSGTAWSMVLNGVSETLQVTTSNTGDWFGDVTSNDNVTVGVLTRSSDVGYFNGKIEYINVYNTPLTVTEAQELYKNDLYREPNLITSTKLDVNPILGYITDSYNHTLTNTAVTLFDNGGKYVTNYNGTTSNLSFADADDLSPSGAYSISAWIKPRNVDKFRIVSKQNEFLLTLTAAFKPYFALYSGGETTRVDVTGGSILGNNKWYHIVVTYNGNSLSTGIKIYVNGVLESPTNGSSGTYAYSATINALKIGYRVGDTTYGNGLIGRARIFNKELSQSEITRLYNSQKSYYV